MVDLPALPDKNSVMAHLNPKTGLIELIDIITGDVVAVQNSHKDLYEHKLDNMVSYDLDGKTVFLEKTLDLDKISAKINPIPHSNVLVDLICQQLSEGSTFTSICKRAGFPSYTLLARWRRDIPGVQEAIEQALQDRASLAHDQILDLADNASTEPEELAKVKIQIDARKHITSKDHSSRYGNKVELTGTQPIQFIIESGITRELPAAEEKLVEEKQELTQEGEES